MISASGLTPTLTESAQENIIQPLINLSLIKETHFERLISLYPSATFKEKSSIVKKILSFLWQKYLCETSEIFPEFEKFDRVLSIIGVRGHFIHQFEVFLLGFYMLNKMTQYTGFLTSFSTKDILTTWLLAATTHDFGYPFQKGPESIEEIAKLYKVFGFELFSDKVIKCSEDISLLRGQQLTEIANGVFGNPDDLDLTLKDFIVKSSDLSAADTVSLLDDLKLNFDHGLVSAYITYLWIMQKCTMAKREDNLLQLSLSAVLLHNIANKKYKNTITPVFNLNKNCFAWILFFIDNIQDWSRDLVSEEILSVCKFKSIQAFDFTKTIEINFLLDHKNWSPEVIRDTDKWLEEKIASLKNYCPKNSQESLTIVLNYGTSTGRQILREKISI